MAMTITVAISVADDQPYTTREAAVIAAMQAHPSQGTAAVVAPAPAAVDMTAHTKEAADARIAESRAKAKAAAEAKAAKAAQATLQEAVAKTPEPAEEPVEEEPEEDLVGAETVHTLDDAVTLATQLVSDGKAPAVKAALAVAGAKRVSELKGDAISAFINELQA